MANRTDVAAVTIHGKNPQLLFSRIVRRKVYESFFWKNDCFAATAESIVDVAVQLQYVGGTYGGIRTPSPFLCIVLKLLQIQPEKEIILEYLKQEDFKYLRAVAAFYFRLTARSDDVYIHLEPLLADYRKLRVRESSGRFVLRHVDELIDDCLRKNTLFDVDLPPLAKRNIFVDQQLLPAVRLSALEDEVNTDGNVGAEAVHFLMAAAASDRSFTLCAQQQPAAGAAHCAPFEWVEKQLPGLEKQRRGRGGAYTLLD
ncbi:pre-mRNA splicing [Cyclospora cayetanensis]|uniref:Pre-mRNA-splicing factor 38 n=1 Tax=Cyclospora cayetanensis TaxID=88456 RepID=A0A1D3D200_9EIME|nr:pre-mRNA splicing [Cyclospora cayetanensis]